MEIGALSKEDFRAWIPFMDAEVLIRHVSMGELREIAKLATRTTWDRKHQKTEEMDAGESNRLLGRAAVHGWKGLTMNGQEYPYSPENCDFLMSKWLEFSRFVNDVCTDLQALVEGELEEIRKNSGLTSGQG